MYWAMGELASDTPATMAPTSWDIPTSCERLAMARHQPMASRNTNSLNASNRASSGMTTNRTPKNAPAATAGKPTTTSNR